MPTTIHCEFRIRLNLLYILKLNRMIHVSCVRENERDNPTTGLRTIYTEHKIIKSAYKEVSKFSLPSISLIHQQILLLVFANQIFITGCNADHLLAKQQHKQR